MDDVQPRLPRDLELVRVLGQGGMGQVLLARDPHLDRLVAVKVVLGGGLVPDAVDRLLREGQALARLRHPGVVPVYEAARIGADIALVMAYVEGSDLEELMTERPPDVVTRLGLLDQLAAGIEAVHAAGIVHRDLKPPNVLVGRDGRLRIADFGLARLGREAEAYRTDAGLAWGTPFYAPMEQLTDPDHEHPAIDRWAFGLIAHTVMLGSLPSQHPAQGGVVAAPFGAAVVMDPAARVTPTRLMELLHAEPVSRWPELTGSAPAAAPVTVRASVPVIAPSVPVLAPPRRRRLLPLVVGLLLGLLAAVALVLLR